MLNFLNISILFGLLGVSIPFLIHLFAKRKQKKIYFSTLRFLKILQPQQLRRIRLKQILLMIIRGLIILFLVLGFSRPVFKESSFLSRSGAASAMSLVIDRSLSLKRSGMLEKLKANIHSVLDLMKSNDKASLLLTQAFREIPFRSLYNKKTLKEKVKNLHISFYKGDLLDKISESIQFLNNQKELNKEIFIFTDQQGSEWNPGQDSSIFNSWKRNIFILPIQGERKNIAVTKSGIKSSIFQSGAVGDVFAEIENFSDNFIEDLLVRISLDDKTVDQMTINLNKNEKQRVEFNAVYINTGWHYGKIRVENGSFPYDNTSYFVYHLPEKRGVFLIGNELNDILPLELCLKALDKNKNQYKVKNYIIGTAWTEELDSTDVIVFSNYPQFRAIEIESLRKFLQQGGNLFFFMGNDINIQQLNQQFFQPIAEITLGNVIRSAETSGSSLSIRNVDYGHPLFKGIFERGERNFKSPQIFKSIELFGRDCITIIDLRNDIPFMVEKRVLNGKIICISTSLQQSWSDFAFSTIFAPLMIRSIGYLSIEEIVKTEYNTVGDRIFLLENPESMEGEFYVQDPDERLIKILPEINNEKILLELENTQKPGIYRFFHNSTQLGLRAINIDQRESDFGKISEKRIKEFFPNSKVYFINNIDRLEQIVSKSRFGRELWKEMILLALGLLIIEMLIAKSKKDKNSEKY